MRASEVLAEFEKGAGRDPRSRLDDLEMWLRAEVEKEAEADAAPKQGPQRKAKASDGGE